MADIFACSMAKKSDVVKMESNADVFAYNVKKQSTVDIASKSDKVA